MVAVRQPKAKLATRKGRPQENEMDEYTRDQAIRMVGLGSICDLEEKNCKPTNRVGVNGACQGDSLTEWSASIDAQTIPDGLDCVLTAYYYTTNEQDEHMAKCDGDRSSIDWVIDHFTIL
jgi:hypothetical protein